MTRLIKMEWYKLWTSKLFVVLLSITFGLNALLAASLPLIAGALGQQTDPVKLSAIIASPFLLGLLMIPVFISAASFLYLDFGGGYVKNIAGQLSDRGMMVFAKFIIIGIHNLVFFLAAVLSHIAAAALTSGIITDGNEWGGIATLLLKWLLALGLCAVLEFFAVGLENKTLSIIMAVVFSTGSLSLLYVGIDAGVNALFHLEGFSVSDYMPDALLNSVSAITGELVINAIIVSVIFIVLFLWLSYITFKKRDIK